MQVCPNCGSNPGVSSGRKARKWCSESCRVAHFRRTHPEYAASCRAKAAARHRATYVPRQHTKVCEACGSQFIARNRQRRSCSDACRYRLNYLARRGHKAGAVQEPYSVLELAERDGWDCQLCSEPIDRELRYPAFRSASVDHRVPLSRGGADTKANVQLAHLDCNRRKGANIEPDPKRARPIPKREAQNASTQEATEHALQST